MKLCARCKQNETPPGISRCAECRAALEAKRRASIDARAMGRNRKRVKDKSRGITESDYKLRITITPEPFVGGRLKRQWRKLRGVIVGIKAGSPWITIVLPDPMDVPLVRTTIHALKDHGQRLGSRRYVYPYRGFVYETQPDSAHLNWLHVRRVY